jgi:hypothetical protein
MPVGCCAREKKCRPRKTAAAIRVRRKGVARQGLDGVGELHLRRWLAQSPHPDVCSSRDGGGRIASPVAPISGNHFESQHDIGFESRRR